MSRSDNNRRASARLSDRRSSILKASRPLAILDNIKSGVITDETQRSRRVSFNNDIMIREFFKQDVSKESALCSGPKTMMKNNKDDQSVFSTNNEDHVTTCTKDSFVQISTPIISKKRRLTSSFAPENRLSLIPHDDNFKLFAEDSPAFSENYQVSTCKGQSLPDGNLVSSEMSLTCVRSVSKTNDDMSLCTSIDSSSTSVHDKSVIVEVNPLFINNPVGNKSSINNQMTTVCEHSLSESENSIIKEVNLSLSTDQTKAFNVPHEAISKKLHVPSCTTPTSSLLKIKSPFLPEYSGDNLYVTSLLNHEKQSTSSNFCVSNNEDSEQTSNTVFILEDTESSEDVDTSGNSTSKKKESFNRTFLIDCPQQPQQSEIVLNAADHNWLDKDNTDSSFFDDSVSIVCSNQLQSANATLPMIQPQSPALQSTQQHLSPVSSSQQLASSYPSHPSFRKFAKAVSNLQLHSQSTKHIYSDLRSPEIEVIESPFHFGVKKTIPNISFYNKYDGSVLENPAVINQFVIAANANQSFNFQKDIPDSAGDIANKLTANVNEEKRPCTHFIACEFEEHESEEAHWMDKTGLHDYMQLREKSEQASGEPQNEPAKVHVAELKGLVTEQVPNEGKLTEGLKSTAEYGVRERDEQIFLLKEQIIDEPMNSTAVEPRNEDQQMAEDMIVDKEETCEIFSEQLTEKEDQITNNAAVEVKIVIMQDGLNKTLGNNETVPESHMNETVPESHVDETVPESHVDETVHESHVNETVPESHVDKTVHESHVDEMVPESHVDETVPESHVDEMVPESHVDEMVPESHVDETVPGSHVDEMVLQSAKELMTSNNERPEADDKQRAELCVSDVISLPKQGVFLMDGLELCHTLFMSLYDSLNTRLFSCSYSTHPQLKEYMTKIQTFICSCVFTNRCMIDYLRLSDVDDRIVVLPIHPASLPTLSKGDDDFNGSIIDKSKWTRELIELARFSYYPFLQSLADKLKEFCFWKVTNWGLDSVKLEIKDKVLMSVFAKTCGDLTLGSQKITKVEFTSCQDGFSVEYLNDVPLKFKLTTLEIPMMIEELLLKYIS